jgi:hypothetical protein
MQVVLWWVHVVLHGMGHMSAVNEQHPSRDSVSSRKANWQYGTMTK